MVTKKKQKMVLKYQYEDLSEEAKIEFREAYLTKSGMPYTTFYYKLRTNTFRPLEQNLFDKLLQELRGSPIEKVNDLSELLNNKNLLE